MYSTQKPPTRTQCNTTSREKKTGLSKDKWMSLNFDCLFCDYDAKSEAWDNKVAGWDIQTDCRGTIIDKWLVCKNRKCLNFERSKKQTETTESIQPKILASPTPRWPKNSPGEWWDDLSERDEFPTEKESAAVPGILLIINWVDHNEAIFLFFSNSNFEFLNVLILIFLRLKWYDLSC